MPSDQIRETVTDEQLRAQMLADPLAQRRIREILDRKASGEPPGPGITDEELLSLVLGDDP